MTSFDDLPKRHKSHVTEERAATAFRARITESEVFVIQTDQHDYGSDYQLEVMDGDSTTNARVHIQLKGTEKEVNADGSVSIAVERANLNYLLAQPYSFYVCYHVPTRRLLFRSADDVLRGYEHSGKNWMDQQTLTISFADELSAERLQSLAALAKLSGKTTRDMRRQQVAAAAEDVPGILRSQVPHLHVPDDRELAKNLLKQLYEQDADELISAAFDRFAAVLGPDDDAMGSCYMAETNLGMCGRSRFPDRIEGAIRHFQRKLTEGRYLPGTLHYTIGNAHSALGREDQARSSFEAAMTDKTCMSEPGLAAQILKNLGTSLERLGDHEGAAKHYRDALQHDPDLPEAHNCLGNYYIRVGRYKEALDHYDEVLFQGGDAWKGSAAAGWRINALFNLGEGRAAFRDINALLQRNDLAPWIWPWCAKQVANFGRTSIDNARQAVTFWNRYLRAHPGYPGAGRELMMAYFYLRSHGEDIGKAFEDVSLDFDHLVREMPDDEAAFLWDRLGHWAQDEGKWQRAEHCYRKAYDLAGGHYGYCLGTALNFLGRAKESLPLLLEQATALQPDAMSWYQVGVAYQDLDMPSEAATAYEKAIELDPDYDLAMFSLGGVHWNNGDARKAREVWEVALSRSPQHELAARLRADYGFLFDGTSALED